ncbi:tRNA pseudouridine(55) synthase TruB [Pleomorphomonas diazotrophica]|uniref:tRNA pseudouridine synthase B n=1 Tax=Pleomorphomonas diazotrophica TaxID=1166257 RepID=A0A1I4T5D9_9HYPH|nr:tRNA pseudouridine(55) synthase TruB [Pleomorphomonas diazotrophica]PKR89549.1 tRNA pseudouridine(55) synthase TruB [Pleomorphomonas diazotrophica]SFM71964.1 tRNA pseudouridine synthase B [Pleomorphomonas diazotrophica]
MARKKKGTVHGWVVLDKPYGMTSTQAVGAMKRIFGTPKAGHAGTLDPLASGMLPIALGEATKTVPYVMDGDKLYRFTVRWGAETSTDDAEGEVVKASDHRPSADDIDAVLDEFEGEILQTPPAFSAIKVDGERAYDLARAGETVELEARPVTVHRLDLVDCPDADTAVFEAECGKGTYVRAIARDMGRRLGTAGHVIELRRLVVGPFGEEDMVTIDALQAALEADGDALSLLTPIEAALAGLPQLDVTSDQAVRLRNGNPVLLRGRDAPVEEEAVGVFERGRLMAIAKVEHGELKPVRLILPD